MLLCDACSGRWPSAFLTGLVMRYGILTVSDAYYTQFKDLSSGDLCQRYSDSASLGNVQKV